MALEKDQQHTTARVTALRERDEAHANALSAREKELADKHAGALYCRGRKAGRSRSDFGDEAHAAGAHALDPRLPGASV